MKIFDLKSVKYIVLCAFLNCGDKIESNFQRDSELKEYLKVVHKTEIDDHKSIIIIISSYCGKCNEETIGFINKLGTKTKFRSYKKFLVLPIEQKQYTSQLQNHNFKVLLDENYLIHRYGLNLKENAFVVYRNSEVETWSWINTTNIDSVENVIFH